MSSRVGCEDSQSIYTDGACSLYIGSTMPKTKEDIGMIVKTTIVQPTYVVPQPYRNPVGHVIKLFRHPYDLTLTEAIDRTYDLYTDRNFKYHIPKSLITKKKLRYHTLKYIETH